MFAPRSSLLLVLSTVITAGVAITASPGGPPAAAPGDEPFFDQPRWSDGRAEVNLYHAVEPRYGIDRSLDEAALIFVKEDIRSPEFVKADDPADAEIPALKLFWSVEVPTGIYTYRQQAVVLLHRRTNRVLRETFASSEWCGNTFKDLRIMPREDGAPETPAWRYRYSSYFEGEADGEVLVAGDREAILNDAMPAWVRTLPAEAGTRRIVLLPTLWSNPARPEDMRPVTATVDVSGPKTVEVPFGTLSAWRVEVRRPDVEPEVYHVSDDRDRRLVRMQLTGDRRYELRRSARIDYWNHSRPEGRSLRFGSGPDDTVAP